MVYGEQTGSGGPSEDEARMAGAIRSEVDDVMHDFNTGLPDTYDAHVAVFDEMEALKAEHDALLRKIAAFGHNAMAKLIAVDGKPVAAQDALDRFRVTTGIVADRAGVTAVEASMRAAAGNARAELVARAKLPRTTETAAVEMGRIADRSFGHISHALWRARANSQDGNETKQQALQRAAELDTSPVLPDGI